MCLHSQVHFHLASHDIWTITSSYALNRANICAYDTFDLHDAHSSDRIVQFDRPQNMQQCEIGQNVVKSWGFSPLWGLMWHLKQEISSADLACHVLTPFSIAGSAHVVERKQQASHLCDFAEGGSHGVTEVLKPQRVMAVKYAKSLGIRRDVWNQTTDCDFSLTKTWEIQIWKWNLEQEHFHLTVMCLEHSYLWRFAMKPVDLRHRIYSPTSADTWFKWNPFITIPAGVTKQSNFIFQVTCMSSGATNVLVSSWCDHRILFSKFKWGKWHRFWKSIHRFGWMTVLCFFRLHIWAKMAAKKNTYRSRKTSGDELQAPTITAGQALHSPAWSSADCHCFLTIIN